MTKREIRKLSNTTQLQIPLTTFAKVVRELTQDNSTGPLRWSSPAIEALQSAAETYLTNMFQRADKAREYKGTHTLSVKDIQYTQHMGRLEHGQEP